MKSCDAAISFGSLLGVVIGVGAIIVFALAAAMPKRALGRRHLLWLLAALAIWGALHARPEFAACYAAALALTAAILIGIALIILIALAARQIGSRSIR